MSWSIALFRFGVILLFACSIAVIAFSISSLTSHQPISASFGRSNVHAGYSNHSRSLQSIIRSIKLLNETSIHSQSTKLFDQSKSSKNSYLHNPTAAKPVASQSEMQTINQLPIPLPVINNQPVAHSLTVNQQTLSPPTISQTGQSVPHEFKTLNQLIHEHIKVAKPKPWNPNVKKNPPTVDQLVSRALELYPNMLTQNPSIDCYDGKYLVVDTWYADGLGSSLTSYASLLQYAIDFNFTIISFPFEASHYDTKNKTLIAEIKRDRATKLDYLIDRWHVPRNAWDACPPDSPVKTNHLFLKTIEFDKFTFVEPRGEHASAVTGVPASMTNMFVGSHNRQSQLQSAGKQAPLAQGNGYTLRIGRWWGYRGCMRRVSLIFAVRRHLTLPPTLPPVLLLSDKPHNAEPSINQSNKQSIELSPTLNVGVHVRQGDRGFYNATTDQFMVRARYREWVMSTGVWNDMLKVFIEAVPDELKPKLKFTVYSEVEDGDVSKLRRYIAPLLDWNLVYSVNLVAIDSMLDMANNQHIFIGSPSDFSRSVCQTNVDVLKLANHRSMQFRHHSCHNTWLYTVDYSEIHPESPEELLNESRLNDFQKLHPVHDAKKRELTERIRAAAARASGEIIPSMYQDDFEMVHSRTESLLGLEPLKFE